VLNQSYVESAYTTHTIDMCIKVEYRHMTYCYACGKSHNVIGLVMRVQNCGFKEAMEWAVASPPSPSPIGRGVGYNRQQNTHNDRRCGNNDTVRGSASSPRGDWGYSNLTKCQDAPTKGSDISYRDGGRREKGAIGREEGAVYGTMREVQQFVSLNNALSKCMRHYFPEDVVTRVTMDYLLGVDYERFHSDHTLFASIDSQDRVHNVKLQEYCTTPTSPMFCHSMKGKTKWVGIPGPPNPPRGEITLRTAPPTPEGETYCRQPPNPPRGEITATSRIEGGNEMAVGCNQPLPFGGDATTWQRGAVWQRGADTDCLFGEHLLKRYPEKIVALVESPKNAIVGACHMPQLLWLACGNKGMLKRELLEVLRGRDVIVYPDRDAVEEWTLKIESMRGLAHFRMADFCKDKTSPENDKMDIADLILSDPSLPSPPRGRSATA